MDVFRSRELRFKQQKRPQMPQMQQFRAPVPLRPPKTPKNPLFLRQTEPKVLLAPVRIDLEHDQQRLRDVFTWNIHEDSITPELFAKILVQDLRLSAGFIPLVAKQIREQVQDFFQHSPAILRPSDDPRGIIDSDVPENYFKLNGNQINGDTGDALNVIQSDTIDSRKNIHSTSNLNNQKVHQATANIIKGRKHDLEMNDGSLHILNVKQENTIIKQDVDVKQEMVNLENATQSKKESCISENGLDVKLEAGNPNTNDCINTLSRDSSEAPCELRTTLKLDISIGNQSIVDSFEWDLANTKSSPEQFAQILVNELGLIPEFVTAIAHSIREQVYVLQKSLLVSSHDFTKPEINDKEVAEAFFHTSLSDPKMSSLGPVVQYSAQSELDRLEKDLDRDLRRKRRQTQRSRRITSLIQEGGKTSRTPIPTLDSIRAANQFEKKEKRPNFSEDEYDGYSSPVHSTSKRTRGAKLYD